jgi:hypothetical protein
MEAKYDVDLSRENSRATRVRLEKEASLITLIAFLVLS